MNYVYDNLNVRQQISAMMLAIFFSLSFLITSSAAAASSSVPDTVSNAESTMNAGLNIVDASSVDLNTLIIGVEFGKSEEEVRLLLANSGVTLLKYWPDFGGALVTLQSTAEQRLQASSLNAQQALAQLEQTRNSLEQLPDFRYVTYNARVTVASASNASLPAAANSTDYASAQITGATPPLVEPLPNDPEFTNQWALNIIRVVDSWNISQGDPSVVVAVIDSGYDISHPDLDRSTLWTNPIEAAGLTGIDDDQNGFIDDIHGWDWVENDDVTNDTFGHGTHVGGTIAATSNNQIGISGIARNVKILPLRILDGQGSGYIKDLVDALDYAKAKGVRIVNLSLVLPFDSPILNDAIATVSDDMMIVAATGNVSANVYWPAAYPGTIAVAATDQQDTYATFSNNGPEVDLAAPGVDILSTGENNDYVDNTGTSMATPHVSALAALISSLRPDFSNNQILNTIQQSAIDINIGTSRGQDEFIGYGRIDVYQSLLNASVGLELEQVDVSDEFSFTRYPVEYNIAVNTPSTQASGAMPVRGAIVHYKLLAVDGTPISQSIDGRVLTAADGVADIVFLAPVETGSYILRTQLGQESVDFPFTVYPVVSNLSITFDEFEIIAGEGSTLVTVKALDSDGNILTTPIPLHLETEMGLFNNGQQFIDVVMNNGTYSTVFYAKTTSGFAAISANIGGAVATEKEIKILSAVPDRIEMSSDVAVIRTQDGETTARITVLVYDIYGNPLNSPFSVNLFTNVGEISPVVSSSSGENSANAIFTVPEGTNEKAVLWAVLPGTRLLTKLKIDVIGKKFVHLPFVVSGQ